MFRGLVGQALSIIPQASNIVYFFLIVPKHQRPPTKHYLFSSSYWLHHNLLMFRCFFCSATCRQVVRGFSTQLISLSASRCQPIDDQQPSAVSLSFSFFLSVILRLTNFHSYEKKKNRSETDHNLRLHGTTTNKISAKSDFSLHCYRFNCLRVCLPLLAADDKWIGPTK